MIRVTKDAKEKLHSLLPVRGGGRVTLRLIRLPSRELGLIIDKQSATDQVIKHHGMNVLLVGKDVLSDLKGTTVALKREIDGNAIVINHN